MKELIRYEGRSIVSSGSPREIIKAAYEIYDFLDEETWIFMLKDRNNMTHMYDGTEAKALAEKILKSYIPTFCKMQDEIEVRYKMILDIL